MLYLLERQDDSILTRVHIGGGGQYRREMDGLRLLSVRTDSPAVIHAWETKKTTILAQSKEVDVSIG
jgi:hypothetical protein